MRRRPTRKACDLTADKTFCDTYHAGDEAYADADPLLDHADRAVPRRAHGREVHDYPEWTQAWTEIKG